MSRLPFTIGCITVDAYGELIIDHEATKFQARVPLPNSHRTKSVASLWTEGKKSTTVLNLRDLPTMDPIFTALFRGTTPTVQPTIEIGLPTAAVMAALGVIKPIDWMHGDYSNPGLIVLTDVKGRPINSGDIKVLASGICFHVRLVNQHYYSLLHPKPPVTGM